MHLEHENESEKELNSDLHAYHLTILLEIQEEVRAKMEEILCADLVDPVEANFQMVTLQICSNEFQGFWQTKDVFETLQIKLGFAANYNISSFSKFCISC